MRIAESFIVTISDDELKAFISAMPAATPDTDFSVEKLKIILKNEGVVAGIKEDILEKIVEDYKQRKKIDSVLIAEGKFPQHGENADVELKFEISFRPKEDASGKIDYREISRIIPVKSGQILAIKKKLKPEINGFTVTGKSIPASKPQDIPLVIGKNVDREEHETLIYFKAKIDGSLKYVNNVLSVSPVLDIENDVDFSTGNIHFDGNVKIGRDVLQDFIVEAQGKVMIWGSAIGCKITATEEIDVRGGIIGKNRCEIQTQKSLQTTFIENAKVKAAEDIIVKNGILGSEVYCCGTVKLENPKSRIVDSTVIAARGIFTHIAGGTFSTTTRLITGFKAELEDEYLSAKKRFEEKLKELQALEKRYGRNILENKNIPRAIFEQAKKDIEKWDSLKAEALKLKEELSALEEEMYDYNAVIVIKETLYPNVLLRIGKIETISKKERYNVTVRYSPEDNCLLY